MFASPLCYVVFCIFTEKKVAEGGHTYETDDVNHDKAVNIIVVTMLINAVLSAN